MPKLTVRARNFRTLGQLAWSPEGVCLLAGANGAGKTTVLSVFEFLRLLFHRGAEAAFQAVESAAFLRLGVPAATLVEFELGVDEVLWKLRFPMTALGLKGPYGEEVHRDGAMVLRAAVHDEGWYLGTERRERDAERCCARVLLDRGEAPWLQPLADLLAGTRVYGPYDLAAVKRAEQISASDGQLRKGGENLWSVLSTWKGASIRYDGQFEWVLTEARRAFPDLVGALEFDRGLPFLFRPGATDPAAGLTPSRAADGLLTGLLHLTAVAGARPGALVAFDEVENQLHPHAIRAILNAMRQRAEEKDLTVVVTTHSPVVMNAFRHTPERLYVLDGRFDPTPRALTELRDEDALLQVDLGELYDRLDFAAPKLDGGAS